MNPPTHRPSNYSPEHRIQAQKVREAFHRSNGPFSTEELKKRIDNMNYIIENPNSPEAIAHRRKMDEQTEFSEALDEAVRPMLEKIERAMTPTGADYEIFVGPRGPYF